MTTTDGQPNKILVVEDDKAMRQSLCELLEAAGWQVSDLSRANKVIEALNSFAADVVLSDVRMPGKSGIDLLTGLNRADDPPVVLISAHGDVPMAVNAMQLGAYSFVEKPYEPRRLLTILQHAAENFRMRRTNSRLKDRLAHLSGLDRIYLGETSASRKLREEILDVAELDVPVLIYGETGTGKELVARALHDLGRNSSGPFQAINCAAIPVEQFEAEMFGVADNHVGQLEAANGGTLFLDELASCPLAVQTKLLRVLEDKQVSPLGASRPVPLDFRIISTMNEDPEQAVSNGKLRADLMFRVNTVMLAMPMLRQRKEDIVLLASHFLDALSQLYEINAPELTHDDIAVLMAHEWPGNVRELRNVCERRVLSARRGTGSIAAAIRMDQPPEEVPETLREAVAVFERELIGKALKAHGGRMEATAEALGIGRRTLNEKIVKLGLDKATLL